MSEKNYSRLVYWLLGLGSALTLGHLGYIVYAYPHSSIVQFIARELWLG